MKTIKKAEDLFQQFPATSGIGASFLGKRFRLENDPQVYLGMGIKGRSNSVVLQAEATDEIKYLSMEDFLQLATRVAL